MWAQNLTHQFFKVGGGRVGECSQPGYSGLCDEEKNPAMREYGVSATL
jgi:hypothetical protein